jgi:2-methylisocitrate lyase-like PEP mutase family enzyme
MDSKELGKRCEKLRSLHVRGAPLLLPNAWDVASARAVEAAGFPVVATTSAGVAAALGHEDHEGAPAGEMLAVAGRIASGVGVPVTVDAEAGYGMEPSDFVAALEELGAAGCNLEDSDHADGGLRDPVRQAEWLGAVRDAASGRGYGLVVNARIDVFVHAASSGLNEAQAGLLPDALRRARTYAEAGVDCVYPIALWEPEALKRFTSEFLGAVNALRIPPSPSIGELAQLGIARVSWGGQLAHGAIEQLERDLGSIREEDRGGPPTAAPAE